MPTQFTIDPTQQSPHPSKGEKKKKNTVTKSTKESKK
jgi:hypothetical protein